ncbi:RNase HII [Archaeoglobus sulfaticallidus PM70-1]|uniref:Ribonuclease HII n=1 Tax=Archaeoglobus sulfaticallidus PM70-1 TaxID=387631 RepID=N0BLJ3_9EURY|nr:ribonuclease HII [Archaeoglobus sulfaticallidus]AGK61070.1 RNase HII [Archaeoglobus sulfaticallidus PM70-1]
MKIAGIDEAGKGPVIGPMVVCCYAIDKDRLNELERLGVKDSKKLTKKRREKIAEELKSIGSYRVLKFEPQQLDELMEEKTINEILYDACEKLIRKVKPDMVFVDSFDVMSSRLENRLGNTFKSCKVRCEHKADDKYPVVASASIIAKVERDKKIEKLKEIYGDFGSGYASDPRTIDFLRDYLRKKGHFPPIVRKKWKTLSKISQRSLDDF